MTTAQRLAAIQRRATRYEVVVTDGTDVFRVGYTPRIGKHGLLRAVQNVGADVVRVCGIGDDDQCRFSGGRLSVTMDFGNGWTARFTGRTEREAILEGEIDSVTNAG